MLHCIDCTSDSFSLLFHIKRKLTRYLLLQLMHNLPLTKKNSIHIQKRYNISHTKKIYRHFRLIMVVPSAGVGSTPWKHPGYLSYILDFNAFQCIFLSTLLIFFNKNKLLFYLAVVKCLKIRMDVSLLHIRIYQSTSWLCWTLNLVSWFPFLN